MSNIYEALIQAQEEKAQETPIITLPEEDPVPSPAPHPPQRREKRSGFSGDGELFDLYQHISGMLPENPARIIQFIGSRQGEGVSTIVREFARASAARFNRRVLIIDAAHHHPTQHLHFKVDDDFGWRDALANGTSLVKACYQSGEHNLYLSPITLTPTLSPRIHDPDAAALLFGELRQLFELIVIDSSPATTSADSVALTRLVDGVVLVLEAEKTRWQMVEKVKNRIVRNGGNILGVILNKRRYHIPDGIYSRL